MNEKFAITKKAGIYGMIGNLFLLIIKAIIGFMSHSQAMIDMEKQNTSFLCLLVFL